MVIENLREMKEKLKLIKDVDFSKHAERKILTRGLKKDIIINILKNPEKIMKFAIEYDKYPGEKYELFFALNKRKCLKIVVNFLNTSLNVVTAHIILNKRVKLVEKWRKKRR